MRIFWRDGGLQLQPESDVEAEAMLVLMANVTLEVRGLDPKDVRVDTYTRGTLPWSSVRLTHIPTGIVVELVGDVPASVNQAALMPELARRVALGGAMKRG